MPQNPFAKQYNTPLSPRDEALFQQWAQQTGRVRDMEDYDLRGAWLKGYRGQPGQHGSDRFKKPNHPTFSSESMYNSPNAQGGQWVETPDGKYIFVATPDNVRYRSPQELQNYFREVEPGNRVVLPAEVNLFRK